MIPNVVEASSGSMSMPLLDRARAVNFPLPKGEEPPYGSVLGDIIAGEIARMEDDGRVFCPPQAHSIWEE